MMYRKPVVAKPAIKTRAFENEGAARREIFKTSSGAHSLTEPIANVPSHIAGALKPAHLKTSSLPNGVRIATLSSNHPLASVGVFVNSGSRFETSKNAGVSFFLQKFGISETHGIDSALRLTRVIEGMNANYVSAAGREQIYYGGEVPAEHADNFASVLFDVINPQFNEYELYQKRHAMEEEIKNIESNPRQLIQELLHQEAFRNKGLGQQLHAPSYNLNNISEEDLRDFHTTTFTPNRIVLVGAGGVEHERLVKLAADLYGDKAARDGPQRPASPYVGGEIRFAGEHETHLALAFNGVGLGASTKDFFAVGILQHILGGGRQLFRGGVHQATSRLNRSVEKNSFIDEATAFNYTYSDAGLFGVFASAHAGHAGQLVKEITSTISGVKNVEKAEVDRARLQLKATILENLERRLPLLEFVGTQIIATSKVVSPEDFVRGLDSVSVDDVRAAAKKVFSSKPTYVALGDVTNLPTIDQVQSSLLQ